MSAFYDCMAAVITALGRRISMEEFDALYTRLLEERDRLFAGGYSSDWLSVARSVAHQVEIEKAIAQRNVIRNKLVHAEGQASIAAARRTVDAGTALEARLVGINAPIEGGRKSVATEAHGLYLTSAGALLADLRRAGGQNGKPGDRLVKLFSTPSFELDIAKALRAEDAHPDAVLIARAIDRTREDLRRQENDAGGWRGKLDGYVTRQSHDSLKVRRAGYDAWKAAVLPRLDQVKTFDHQEELRAQLRHERAQVLQQQLAAKAELSALQENLGSAEKLDAKASNRTKRWAKEIAAERTAFAVALRKLLDFTDRPSLTAEMANEKAAALVELERARQRIRTRELKSDVAAADRERLAPQIEAGQAMVDRATRSLELYNELQTKMIDYDKRLHGAIDPDAFLQRIYNAIAADTWMRGQSEEFKGLLSSIGPSNVARRRAAHRELHFRSAEDEVAYMRQFGAGGVADGVLRDIEGGASAIALQRNLGNNPEAMFRLWQTELLQEAKKTGDNKLATAVTRKRLEWQLAEVQGASRQVANPTVAAYASGMRVLQGMAKLGGAMLSSFGDVATAASELRYQGRGALQAYGDMLGGLMHGRRAGEKRVIGDLLGVGFESLSGTVLARIGGESAPPGAIGRASALFFRLNGLSWWTDAHKTTAGLVISHFFAGQKDVAFDALPKPTQRLLGQYGIKPADWDLLRRATPHSAEDGSEFITPESIKQIPLGWIMEHAGPQEGFNAEADPGAAERLARARRDRLAGAYAALVTDRVDHAVVTPGARERAVINMGTERGDLLGEALRFIMQFKSFNVAMMTRSIGRDIYGGEGGGKLSATARVAFLAFQLGVWGYLAMSAKELIAGKNPRDPLSPNTWGAALMQGGGMGILGDYAFGEFNRFGQSALETAAGPTLGTASDLFSLYAQARDPEGAAAGRYGPGLAAHGLRFIASNTPYANLWWTAPALKYLALYPVQEALAPGYLQRMTNRIQRENKQTFWLPPTEAPRL